MPTVSRYILVRMPVEKVFAFVADPRNTTRIQREFSRFEPIGEPAYGLGMAVDARGSFKGFPVRAVVRVTEFVKNERIVSVSTEGVASRAEWVFSPDEDGCRVQFTASFEWPVLLPSLALGRMAEEELTRLTESALRQLKRLVEAAG